MSSGLLGMAVPLVDLAAQHRELRTEIDAAIAQLIDASAFVGGAEVRAFEEEFAAYTGARHAVGVANGTDALEIALQALGIGRGDVVLVPAFTFAAAAEAVVRVGATPRFVDISEQDFNIDGERAIAAMRGEAVRAIIVVHLFGQPADMERLLPAARERGIVVIEDAAQAHGAACRLGGRTRRVGSLGDAACFSFYPTKNLGGIGDGGAITTDSDDIARYVRLLANHGEASKYTHVIPDGRNSRLDALQAAVLRIKLRRLDAWNEARRKIAALYDERLRDTPVRIPLLRPGVVHAYHQYAVRVAERERIHAQLAQRGIGTAVHYPRALHEQQGFRSFASERLPAAEKCAREVLSLPMHPHLTREAVEKVTEALLASL